MTPDERKKILTKANKTVSIETVEKMRRSSNGSICGLLGSIYYSIEDEGVRLEIRKAMRMAKRMAAKLKLVKAEKIEQEDNRKTAVVEAKKRVQLWE